MIDQSSGEHKQNLVETYGPKNEKYIYILENSLTQNLTRKNALCGPLSNSSLRPPFFSGNLS